MVTRWRHGWALGKATAAEIPMNLTVFPCIKSRNYYFLSMNVIVSEKGQVTIPKELRDKLGLRTGSVLQFSDENGILKARKFQQQDPIRKWQGRAKIPGGLSVDEYLKQTRDAHCS